MTLLDLLAAVFATFWAWTTSHFLLDFVHPDIFVRTRILHPFAVGYLAYLALYEVDERLVYTAAVAGAVGLLIPIVTQATEDARPVQQFTRPRNRRTGLPELP